MRNTKTIFIIVVVGILLIGGLGFFIFNSKKGSLPEQASLVAGSGGVSGESSDGSEAPRTDFPGTSLGNQASGSKTAELSQTYSNTELGFSFNYPEGLNVSGFTEGEIGYTILAQKPGSRESFQIFVSEFDEAGPITPERIKQDLPDMVIEDPKLVILGGRTSEKIEALIFFSKNESLGRTREVWFVRNGKLYQLTTYADLDNLIGPILETLKFP